MKKKLKNILDCFHRYNAENAAFQIFGLDSGITYDALVAAPNYTPYKLKMERFCDVTLLKEDGYNKGYLLKADGLNIAWIVTGVSESNLIDNLGICGELTFKKMIFAGSAGALRPDITLGSLFTPSCAVYGGVALSFLEERLEGNAHYEKIFPDMTFPDRIIALGKERGITVNKATVFCTPSILGEYCRLDEIRATGADLIEMETAAFYKMADLLEVPAAALLAVSDNSASGAALIGMPADNREKYERGRRDLAELIIEAAKIA